MIRAKKSLGQHFLNDENIARKIVSALADVNTSPTVVEVGPGQGILTKYLLEQPFRVIAIEKDDRMVEALTEKYPAWRSGLIHTDFLKFDLRSLSSDSVSLIGNFPYNISTEILFKVFESRNIIPLMVGMFQKEVAQRIAAKHGNKDYGVPTVLLQAFYEVDYLFDVSEKSFSPPPKVKSAVIRLRRKPVLPSIKNEDFFISLVKSGFNQRRKMLANSLKRVVSDTGLLKEDIFSRRAEQLSVQEWINLANSLTPD